MKGWIEKMLIFLGLGDEWFEDEQELEEEFDIF